MMKFLGLVAQLETQMG